jgi:hypothetical protein
MPNTTDQKEPHALLYLLLKALLFYPWSLGRFLGSWGHLTVCVSFKGGLDRE